MFQDIRRHQKWLWVVISSAVIISFVVYFNPNQKYRSGDAGGSTAVGTIYGAPLERTEYVAAYQEAELRYLFSYGEWPGRDQVSRQMRPVERETRNRLVLVRKLTDYNIQVPDSSAAAWIAEAFAGKDNKVFRKEDLNLFVQNNLTPRGLQVEDFYRFARHEVGIQHLINVAGLAGRLVTPQEAEVSYRAENEQLETQVVLFSVSNYLAQVKIDATALAGFYTNQAANYRVPERAQVSYVTFGASNYFAQADQRIAQETNLNQRINEIYLQRGTNYYTGTNGLPLAAEAAKAKIKMEVRTSFALIEARRVATDFATKLLDMPEKKAVANLQKLATENGLLVLNSEAFPQESGPRSLKVPARFGTTVFQLTTDEPLIEEPVVGEDAVYVVGLKARFLSELPALEGIKARVTEDFRRSLAQSSARSAGMAFAAAATNGLAQGKTFQALCTQLGATAFKLSPFSQTTQSVPELDFRQDLSSIKNVAFSLNTNQASGFNASRDGGFVVHLVKQLPASESLLKTELPAYLTNLRKSRQQEAFYDWLQKETALAKVQLAGDSKEQ